MRTVLGIAGASPLSRGPPTRLPPSRTLRISPGVGGQLPCAGGRGRTTPVLLGCCLGSFHSEVQRGEMDYWNPEQRRGRCGDHAIGQPVRVFGEGHGSLLCLLYGRDRGETAFLVRQGGVSGGPGPRARPPYAGLRRGHEDTHMLLSAGFTRAKT